MITIGNLRYRHLAVADLQIAPGITSVIGPNGSGKTTFLRLLAGIAVPESGGILIDGLPPRKTEIGWVNEFPDRNILFGNVFDEIASPLRFRHVPCTDIRPAVESVAGSVGISHLMTRPVRDLSGGEKILVAFAAALVLSPRLLVLDEFDSHLDVHRAGKITDIVRRNGTSYLIHCTQDMEAAAHGDTVIFLQGGNIVHTGNPEEVFASLAGTPYYPLSWKYGA
jgi:energy-coupling factor transport system ATP-binding protein